MKVKMCKMLFWRDHVEVLWLKKKEKVKAKVKHNKKASETAKCTLSYQFY